LNKLQSLTFKGLPFGEMLDGMLNVSWSKKSSKIKESSIK
jgi:hypothetical protein